MLVEIILALLILTVPSGFGFALARRKPKISRRRAAVIAALPLAVILLIAAIGFSFFGMLICKDQYCASTFWAVAILMLAFSVFSLVMGCLFGFVGHRIGYIGRIHNSHDDFE